MTDTVGGTTTNIYYDGTQELEDKSGSTWTVRNVWGDAYVNELVLRDNGASLGTRLYPTEDANWNVTGLVNTSGSVVERGVYDPFGAEQYYNASWGSISGSAYAWTISFQSMRFDTTTGDLESQSRFYDPTQMRWTSNDPSLYSAGDPNLYRFVGNVPIGRLDPSGLIDPTVTPLAGRFGAAGTVAGVMYWASSTVFERYGVHDWFADRWIRKLGLEEPHHTPIQRFAEPKPNINETPEAPRPRKQETKVCFAAGTPIRMQNGSKAIQDIAVGDLVLSRDEHDPNGPVSVKNVEEVFVAESLVLEFVVANQVIRTTAMHPFYVAGQGWRDAIEIREGDILLCENGATVVVQRVRDTGKFETVYNFRIADYHTYFVGCALWGFSVWAHNACIILTRYTVPPGVSASARHWSVEVTSETHGVAVNSHQNNETDGAPDPLGPIELWQAWHPPAHIEKLAPSSTVPGMTVDRTRAIEVSESQALAAKTYVERELAKPPYPYDLYTASCATYVGDVLYHAAIVIPEHPTGRLSAGKLVAALNSIVERN